jgi:pseudouridine-5'-phosphate glycosidase
MTNLDRAYFQLNPEVSQALELGKPVVALESTVITHGLPYPENIKLAKDLEKEIREEGCIPATIAIIAGKVHIGLDLDQLEELIHTDEVVKVSSRDIAPAIVGQKSGGTTVAGTLAIAALAGIKVFATGGIGGVHRGTPFDVSADLGQLARSQLIVVCAGAKAILDIPATLEVLETYGVPVIGYQTDEFPAFYSVQSGLPVGSRINRPNEIGALARTHWGIGQQSSILVVVPPPEDVAISPNLVESAIQAAITEAEEKGIRGKAVTPFLLQRVSELTGGLSLKANLGLLRNNARVAAKIAHFI